MQEPKPNSGMKPPPWGQESGADQEVDATGAFSLRSGETDMDSLLAELSAPVSESLPEKPKPLSPLVTKEPELPPPVPAESVALRPPADRDASFTSLLSTFQKKSQPAPQISQSVQRVTLRAPVAPVAQPASSSNGFTELLRVATPSESGLPQRPVSSPVISRPAPVPAPTPAAQRADESGDLSSLLSSLASVQNPPAAPPQQFSAPPLPASASMPFIPQPSSSGNDYPNGSQRGFDPSPAARAPFPGQPQASFSSNPAAPADASVTGLIRILDNAQPARQEPASLPAPLPGPFNHIPMGGNIPQASASGSAPSEYTQYLQTSRQREEELHGGPSHPPGPAQPAAAAPAASPISVSAAMPQYSMPQYPSMPSAVPFAQPGSFSYGAPPVASAPASMPVPQVQVNRPSMPTPPPVQVQGAAPLGKMQQFIPLLLILIIFLLLGLIITVIFLMKK